MHNLGKSLNSAAVSMNHYVSMELSPFVRSLIGKPQKNKFFFIGPAVLTHFRGIFF